jgi:hypothetical protein
MDIIVGCEMSGIVRNAFLSAGHNAISCDLKETLSPGPHIVGDILEVIYSQKFDFGIFHPPCTYLAKCQGFRCVPGSFYWEEQKKAVQFVKDIYNSPLKSLAIENPSGALTRLFRPPDQIIYPWWFGDPHSKDIALWLKKCPPLIATVYSTKRRPMQNHVNGRMSSHLKSEIKSKFFPLVAESMAKQWGSYANF